jgi:hypothetical protein
MKPRDLVISIIVIVVLVAGIAGYAFYQDEVTGYIRLQGWNTGPVTQATRDLVAAGSKADSGRVEEFIAPNAPQVVPVVKNGKVTAFQVPDYGGPKTMTLKQLFPTGNPTIDRPRLVFLEGGSVAVNVTYPRIHTLDLRWDLRNGRWKLTSIGWISLK